jgi:tRNA (cmo5U34)-methyltransferase
MVAELSDWFLFDSGRVYDLGTSTGEAIKRIYERHEGKKLEFFAVDLSQQMLDKARTKLANVPNVQFARVDLNEPFEIADGALVTSVLTLQFLRPATRPRLVERVYQGLRPGGGFILVEKILGNSPRTNQMWVELYHDMKRRNSLSHEQIADKQLSLRGVLIPHTLQDNLAMLKTAGFNEVDVFFKWYNWAGILAIK